MIRFRHVFALAAAAMALVVAAPIVSAQSPEACAAKKLKATSKKAAKKLGCYAKATKAGVPVDPECLLKAEESFEKAFLKAEEAGGCATSADAPALEAIVDGFVGAAVAALTGPLATPTITPTPEATASPTPTAVEVLLLSELQTRGSAGGNDEFVEIYNPGTQSITFDATWSVTARSASGTCTSNSEASRFSGAGQVIPPHGHLLFANSAASPYDGGTISDATYTSGIVDAASVVLRHNGVAVDAVCFYFDAATSNNLTTCATPYTCEGSPVQNPHDNTSGSNSDTSIERKPGGAAGNTQDTDASSADFATTLGSNPQNLASTPAP